MIYIRYWRMTSDHERPARIRASATSGRVDGLLNFGWRRQMPCPLSRQVCVGYGSFASSLEDCFRYAIGRNKAHPQSCGRRHSRVAKPSATQITIILACDRYGPVTVGNLMAVVVHPDRTPRGAIARDAFDLSSWACDVRVC